MLSSPIIPHYPVSLPTTTRQALRVQSLRSVVWIPACRRLMIRDGISRRCAGIGGATSVASCLIQYSIYLTSFRRSKISAWTPCWYRLSRERTWPDTCPCELRETRLCLKGLCLIRSDQSLDGLMCTGLRSPVWFKLTDSRDCIVLPGLRCRQADGLPALHLEPAVANSDGPASASP